MQIIKNLILQFFRFLVRLLYRVEIEGLENYAAAGDRVLVVANHSSYLDAALLALFLPDKPIFAINTFVAELWWVKPFLNFVKTYALDPTNPMSTKDLIAELKQNQKVVIFPEGRLTMTGALMKVYEGPGMVADKADAVILPVRIEGAQYSPFSVLKGIVRIRPLPKIKLSIMPARKLKVADELNGRARRAMLGNELHRIMCDLIFESSNYRCSLFQSLLDARHIHGAKAQIITDMSRETLSYGDLVLKSFALGLKFAENSEQGEALGLLLPNSNAAVLSFWAMQAFERVPAMLNFTVGAESLINAAKTAQVKTIISSRRFIEQAKLEDLASAIEEQGIKILYLEDLKESLNLWQKLSALYLSITTKLSENYHAIDTEKRAVILFTSGSEGKPKAVVLSHSNLQANRYQFTACFDSNPSDFVFNALPLFHSFGLMGGMIITVLSGVKTFFYPSPLHYRVIPELVYNNDITIMFGTDTFLRGYARSAHAYDFYSLRYVLAGAEKVKDETRETWANKFGVRVLEGYGATEASPGISSNTPMHCKHGTVGKMMPSMEYRLESVEGIDEGGRLFIKGPNIMKGYYFSDNPGVLVEPEDGWYDTGDIVDVDEEGFFSIKGRAKRFAKIAGEMVSLTAVEAYVAELWEGHLHAVIAVPDEKKGEQLILFTEYVDAKREDLIAYVSENNLGELSIPKEIRVLDAVPVLGTGKINYIELQGHCERTS